MIRKIKGAFKGIWYKIRYGSKIKLNRFPLLDKGAQIKITDGSVVADGHLELKPGAYIAAVHGGRVELGDSVYINRHSMLICHEHIKIGDGCSIGPNTLVYDHDHIFDESGLVSGFKTSPVIIEKNCWIAGGVTILRGTHIGEGCVIGAGAVISGSIPPHSIVKPERNVSICPIR